MIRTDFPELAWLKRRVAERFAGQEPGGWPTVVLHTHTRQCYRPDIAGPLSLFRNVHGRSRCTADGRTVLVEDERYFLTNPGQAYTLEIDEAEPVETFNIHFGQALTRHVYHGPALPTATWLDDPHRASHLPDPILFNHLQQPGPRLHHHLTHLHALVAAPTAPPPLLLEAALVGVLEQLFEAHGQAEAEAQALPLRRPATRAEVYRRLRWSVDYLHSHYQRDDLTLDELAAVACLSKYHYLRLFRAALGSPPHAYLLALRLEKAQALLRRTRHPIADIALRVGFQNLSSFSRLFGQRVGVSASHYRQAAG